MRFFQAGKWVLFVVVLSPTGALAQTKPPPKTGAAKPAVAKPAIKSAPVPKIARKIDLARSGPPCTPGISRHALWHMRAGFEFFDLDMIGTEKDAAGGKGKAIAGERKDDVDSITYDDKTGKISFRRIVKDKGKALSQWFVGCISRSSMHGYFSHHDGATPAPRPTNDEPYTQHFFGKRPWRQPIAAVAAAPTARFAVPKFAVQKSPCTPRASRHSIWRVNANGYPLAFDLSLQSNVGAVRSIGVNDKIDSIAYDVNTAKLSFRRLGANFTQWFDGCVANDRIIGRFAHLGAKGAAKPVDAEFIYSFHGHRLAPFAPVQKTRWSRDKRMFAPTSPTQGPRR